jgi:hypothetical protein
VEPARDLVAVAAELAAGVELREDDRERGQSLLRHDVHRDARAPVRDAHRVVRPDDHLDLRVAAGEGLVDRVVHDLVDEVVEASLARRSDVHPGAQADGLEALENGDVLSGIGGFGHEKSPGNNALSG